jgi:hypothetical protein
MSDKTKEMVEAAKQRAKLAKEAEAQKNTDTGLSPEAEASMKDAAEEKAAVKVQARDGTIDGKIDVEAMGDVKGDGRDAKDYEDSDPDKAKGVPVYKHGLSATKDGVDEAVALNRAAGETRFSKRTEAEINRGKEVLNGSSGRTTKTDKASKTRK